MNLTWSQEAGENLVDIEEFIARDSVERAVRFVDALIDQTEAILADSPRSGRTVPEIGNPDISRAYLPRISHCLPIEW